MAVSTVELLINIKAENRKGLLVAFTSAGTRGFPLSIRHEAPTVTLRCVQPGIPARLWDDVDLEAARAAGGVRLALGEFDKAPDSGTWPLLYDGVGTGLAALAFDITAAALKTLLNAHAGITADGGIATVAQTGRSYRITFSTFGAKDDFTTGDNDLLPLSTVTISRVRTGDVDTHEVVVITVKRNAYAFQDAWTASAAASAVADTAIEGVADANNDVQTITLTPGTYGGSYNIDLVLPNFVSGDGTTPVSRGIILSGLDNAQAVLTKLLTHPEAVDDAGVAGITVTGPIGGPFTVNFTEHLGDQDITEMVATNIDLLAPKSVTAEFNLNNDAMLAAFDAAGTPTITLTAELELEFPGQSPSKPYQDSAIVRKDVIDLETTRPAPTSSYSLPGLVPQFRRDITSFALLGAVVTATGGVQCVLVDIAAAPRVWGLFAGTDATDTAAGIKRPDDYNGATNAYVWKSVL